MTQPTGEVQTQPGERRVDVVPNGMTPDATMAARLLG
jgi:hypothetical protein